MVSVSSRGVISFQYYTVGRDHDDDDPISQDNPQFSLNGMSLCTSTYLAHGLHDQREAEIVCRLSFQLLESIL